MSKRKILERVSHMLYECTLCICIISFHIILKKTWAFYGTSSRIYFYWTSSSRKVASTLYLNLLNSNEFGEFIAVSFYLIFNRGPPKSFKKHHFIWPKKAKTPELKSKTNQTCPTFWGITFDWVELQKWSCTLEKPQTICQRLIIHVNGARMDQLGLRGYFRKTIHS